MWWYACGANLCFFYKISCVGGFGSNSYMYKINGTANINAIRAASDQGNWGIHISYIFFWIQFFKCRHHYFLVLLLGVARAMPILIFLFELITTATEPYSTKWDLLNRSNDKTRLNKNLEKKIVQLTDCLILTEIYNPF